MTPVKVFVLLLTLLGLGGAAYAIYSQYTEPVVTDQAPTPIEAPTIQPMGDEVASQLIPEEEYLPEFDTPTTSSPKDLPNTSVSTSTIIHHPDAILQEEDMNRITTAWEYVVNYAGTCPSAQPDDSVFKNDWKHRAAIGLWSDYPTPEHFVETYWNQYKKGQQFATEEVMATFPMLNLTGADDIGFYVNWSTFDVYYDSVWPERRPRAVTATERAQADEMAIRMKNYLHYIDNLYHTRCPNN